MIGTEAHGLETLISLLPTTQRYVVLMFFADELTPDEIALVLDMTRTKVEAVLDTFREAAAGLLAEASSSTRVAVAA